MSLKTLPVLARYMYSNSTIAFYAAALRLKPLDLSVYYRGGALGMVICSRGLL
jgi:hypothetical protein